jgi:hypothetical protein
MISPARLYISSPPTELISPYARLAQAFNLLGRVIRHCDDQDQGLAFMLEEMSTLHQAVSALIGLITNEESENTYVALAVCFRYVVYRTELAINVYANISSALMKLHKGFLSRSFHQVFIDKANSEMASRIREYSERSLNTMRDISLKAVYLAQWLERHVALSDVEKLSPIVLHCLYRAAFWLSYLAGVNEEERFVSGRSILDRVLKALSLRWKLAGMCKSLLFVY